MFYYAIATLHVIVCIILVLVVLLQSGKGADLAGAFGGGALHTELPRNIIFLFLLH